MTSSVLRTPYGWPLQSLEPAASHGVGWVPPPSNSMCHVVKPTTWGISCFQQLTATSACRFAEKNGYPVLENVALPRIGALHAVVNALTPQDSLNNGVETKLQNGSAGGVDNGLPRKGQ